MKLLLLCLGLTLVWAHEEGHNDVVTSNSDLSKISGDWHTILLASDEMEKIEENGSFRIFMKDIQALDSSSMLFSFYIRLGGGTMMKSIIVPEGYPKDAREPDVSSEMKTWFQEVCQEYGIPKENILDLTKVDRSLQARGSY
ncbi:lipocalin Can f 6.0101-like [Hipposideros larvatus]